MHTHIRTCTYTHTHTKCTPTPQTHTRMPNTNTQTHTRKNTNTHIQVSILPDTLWAQVLVYIMYELTDMIMTRYLRTTASSTPTKFYKDKFATRRPNGMARMMVSPTLLASDPAGEWMGGLSAKGSALAMSSVKCCVPWKGGL